MFSSAAGSARPVSGGGERAGIAQGSQRAGVLRKERGLSWEEWFFQKRDDKCSEKRLKNIVKFGRSF